MDLLPPEDLLDEFGLVAPVPGVPDILLYQSDRVMDLWAAWEEETDQECDIPFWAVAWPAAVVLTRLLKAHPELVTGRQVLDIGCGSGLVSIACSLLGAKQVTANDTDDGALAIAQKNAFINEAIVEFNGNNLLTEQRDIPYANLILIADMFYTKKQSKLLMNFILDVKMEDTVVLIGDAGRNFVPTKDVEEVYRETVEVNPDLEQVNKRTVRILKFTGKGHAE